MANSGHSDKIEKNLLDIGKNLLDTQISSLAYIAKLERLVEKHTQALNLIGEWISTATDILESKEPKEVKKN